MKKLLVLFLFFLASTASSENSYYHFGDPKKPDYFKQDDPFGINHPFSFEEKPSNIDFYQSPYRPPVPIQRIPTNDQDTIQPYQLNAPGVIRNW